MNRFMTRALTTSVLASAFLLLTACGGHDGMPGMDHDAAGSGASAHAGMSGMPGMGSDTMPVGDGRSATVAGLTLRLDSASLPAGQQTNVRFRILGADSKPVTTYEPEQTKLMHFYLVRSDLTGFQHIHPELAGDGTWTATAQALQPGNWRAYTSFTAKDAAGKQTPVVLGEQLTVAGTAATVPLPAPAASTQVDGYTLTISGEPMAKMDHTLNVTVSRDGKPVTDLQPYLDTYAHLTAFHEGDLAFAHLHPHGAVSGDHGGPTLDFEAMFPQPGTWRLFLQFQTAGTVHTAAVSLKVG